MLVPAAHTIVIAMGGVQGGRLWRLRTSNIQIIVCSHHTTRGQGGGKRHPWLYGVNVWGWWKILEYFSSLGCMECTYGVFFISWLYGVYVWGWWKILKYFSPMMNITRVFFIFLIRILHTTRGWTSALVVWRLCMQIRILPVCSLHTTGGKKYSSNSRERCSAWLSTFATGEWLPSMQFGNITHP